VNEPVEYYQVLAKKSVLSSIGRSKSTSAGANSDDSVEGAWGKATANVDISADRCLAYMWHCSYAGNIAFEKKNGKLPKMQIDEPNSHSMFIVNSIKIPFPGIDSRVFVTKWVWRRERNGTFVAAFTSKGT
jgi:hypothetical protein